MYYSTSFERDKRNRYPPVAARDDTYACVGVGVGRGGDVFLRGSPRIDFY